MERQPGWRPCDPIGSNPVVDLMFPTFENTFKTIGCTPLQSLVHSARVREVGFEHSRVVEHVVEHHQDFTVHAVVLAVQDCRRLPLRVGLLCDPSAIPLFLELPDAACRHGCGLLNAPAAGVGQQQVTRAAHADVLVVAEVVAKVPVELAHVVALEVGRLL
jgi:hypothetical protein